MRLYHFTCDDHGAPGINRTGLILPNTAALWAPFAWFTTEPNPDGDALGLGQRVITTCDRMAVRYRVLAADDCAPWVARRRHVDAELADALESADGAKPETWWISRRPVPVRLKGQMMQSQHTAERNQP